MLNFKEAKGARPIAIIKEGQFAGNILWLHDDPELAGGAAPSDPTELINPKHYIDGKKTFTEREMAQIHHAIKAGYAAPEVLADPRLTTLYNRTRTDVLAKSGREINLSSGKFVPIPMNIEGQRQVTVATGPSGSGKSFFGSGQAEIFHEMKPENDILLFTKKDDDPAFDKLPFVKRVDLTSLLETKIEPSEIPHTLCIFDDFETLDKELKEAVVKLKDDILVTGRQYDIPVIICSHISRDAKATKHDNNESTHYVVYKNGNVMHNKKLLKEYVGLDAATIEKVLKQPSRWMMISKWAPMHVITENSAFLI
jgi:hypothetical protein